MIGIILTGHGNFATGIYSTIELLGGEQTEFKVIDFVKGMTADELHAKFKTALTELSDAENVVFFTDIPGGTPFNEAVKLKMTHNNVEVLAGTNVSMIMEVLYQRDLALEPFVKAAITAGQSGIVQFKMRKAKIEDDSEGI